MLLQNNRKISSKSKMLAASSFDRLTIPILELYERYTQSVINDIARRLVKMGTPTATAAWQLQRLTESGLVYENAISQLAILTGQSEKVLKKTFEAAGVKAMRFDDSIYKAAGLKPLPLNLSPAMVQVLKVGLQRTNGRMSNLTLTTAINSKHAFIKAADLAYLQVTSGVMSYDQAIKAAVTSAAGDGLWVNYPSGHRDRLDVAMRRTVLTGVGQTTGELQITRAEEMGQDLVQVSAHAGARPSHSEWQGGIFSRSGADDKFPDFVEGTGYGSGAGLSGWNCRHSFYPYFKGISENAYNKLEQAAFRDKQVTFEGTQMSLYEATQKQRYIERQIRDYKRQANALSAAGLDNTREIGKMRGWQARMRKFVGQTGLSRQGVREGGRALKKIVAPIQKVFESVSPDWLNASAKALNLTPVQTSALNKYIGVSYGTINRQMRGGPLSKYASDIPVLKSIFRPIGRNVNVYRGMGVSSKFMEKFVPGAVFKDPAFMSVTGSKSISRSFGTTKDKILRLKIRVPKITKFIPIGEEEIELLLAPNTKFRIIDVRLVPNTADRIFEATMEVIP